MARCNRRGRRIDFDVIHERLATGDDNLDIQTSPLTDRDADAAAALLAPGSIVVVGASSRSRWSTAILANLTAHRYRGTVHLVNPRGGHLDGRPVAESCAALSTPVDLGIVIVPAAAVLDTMNDLAVARVHSAMILTSGFAEVGDDGLRLQERLSHFAREHSIRLLGPNSLGFMNFVNHAVCWVTPIAPQASTTGVAIVSQSGATALFLADTAFRQGVTLSHVVATGNEADLDCSTFAYALVRNDTTHAIAMFVESIRQPDHFIALADAAAAARKPLVVLKVGSSEISARSALAHTAALVGDDRVFNGVCESHGVIRVDSLEDLVTTADLVGRLGVLKPGGLCVVTNSGGVCEIAADRAEALHVDLPAIPESLLPQIRQSLPSYATANNPLDLTGGVVPAECENILATLASASEYSALLVPFYPVPSEDGIKNQRLSDLHHHIAKALRESPTPGFVVSYTESTITPFGQRVIDELKIPYLASGLDRALGAMSRAFRWSEFHRRPASTPHERSNAMPLGTRPQSEVEVLDALQRNRVPVVEHRLVTSESDAIEAAAAFARPVAIKVASSEILHKTDIGGVALNVFGAEDVAAAYRRVIAAGVAHGAAPALGALVSPMMERGIELFVGCSQDPTWGPIIVVGLGGIWVEVFSDVTIRPLPATPVDVKDMLRSLRGSRLLNGSRNLPGADLDAVANAVSAIGDFALRCGPHLVALDINPLWVRASHVAALDGLAEWTDHAR